MPRNAAGNYTAPAGNPVSSGTTIASTWANPTVQDIGGELQDSLSRSGKGSMLAPLKHTSGAKGAPSLTFSAEPQTGFYRAAAGDIRLSISGVDTFRLFNGQAQIWDTTDSAWYPLVTSEVAGAVVETQTLAAAQTVVPFTKNVAGAGLYLDGTSGDRGRLLLGTDYTYDAPANEVTLTTSYPDGTNLFAIINDETDVTAAAEAAAASAGAAATSETNAAASAGAAATSETNAAASAGAAATSEANAATSETNAATSETNAAASAGAAATSETNAATSETNAATSASDALASETNAATSETNAATSETNAATSATSAATSATSAAESANNAAGVFVTDSTQTGELAVNTIWLIDSSAVRTRDLPSAPVDGSEVAFKDNTGTASANTITIGRNGSTIMGLSEDLVVNVDRAVFNLKYVSGDWRVV